MRHHRPVLVIGIAEILIGGITLLWNLLALGLAINAKSPGVFAFVMIAGLVSVSLGIGILKFKKAACYLLLYFSSVVILSKVLIFLNVIELNGSLETTVPGPIKNAASVIYHGFVILYLKEKGIHKLYHR